MVGIWARCRRVGCFASYVAFALTLLPIALVNIETMMIYDRHVFPAAVLFLAMSFGRPAMHWYDGLIGAAIWFAVPWAIREYRWRTAERDDFGLGCVKLLGAVGAFVGWKGALATLFGAAFVGALWGSARGLVRRDENPMTTEIGFAPFMAIASVAWLVIGPELKL